MKFASFCFLVCSQLAIITSAQDIQGAWQTSVPDHGRDLRYVVHITKANGAIAATLDVPEHFQFGDPADSILFNAPVVNFRAGQVSYEGSLSADGQSIHGAWSLGGSGIWQRVPPGPANKVEAVAIQLKSLMHLPEEEWKIHEGDVPHGEAVDLDDSSWKVVGPNSVGPHEAVWYRRLIEIPKTLNGYDLTGAKIWFDFQDDANGPATQIVYFNGRRVAMGDDLEPIVLFNPAKPGDKILVAVKLLQTVDQKHFTGADLRIDYSGARPNPTYLFQEMGSISILAPNVGPASVKLQAELAKAADTVDLDALARADQVAFDQSLTKAHALLVPLKSYLQQTPIRLTGNSHIDAAWLWPWTETVDVVRRTFGTALQLMDEYPKYTYTQSAAAYSEWMMEKYPSVHQQIVDRVKQGRWEMVGGMWVEPDLNMPDGESLVRQLLIGKRFFSDKFGSDVRIGWNPDSFGYNWQLPQIYKKSGVDYFVTQKMTWNDTNQLPMKLFWWQSPDGSRVLTYFPHDYVNDIEPLRIASDVAALQTASPGVPEMMHLYGVGDHGGGPTRVMLEDGMHWTSPDVVFPKASFGVAQGFFSDVEGKADTAHAPLWNYKVLAAGNATLPTPPEGKFSLPVWNDELYFEYHRGVFTSQANHKRNMRESEEQLLNAEKYSSLAWLSGTAYPGPELTEAWKKVLFNQFHDLAAGSGIADIYRDAQRDYDFVRLQAEHVTSGALNTIAHSIDTQGQGVPLLVINPLAWERTDLVTLSVQLPEAEKNGFSIMNSKGEPQPFQTLTKNSATNTYQFLVEAGNIPPLGYRVLHVVPHATAPQNHITVNGLTLENDLLRVTVDSKTGCISSLYDKNSKFESIAANACGNELIAFKDTPRDYDAWNIDADFDQHFTKLDMVDSVAVTERGPLRATIRVVRNWQNSKFVQDISIYSGLNRVDVANEIDWHETHVLLKAAFPLAASGAEATYEIPYGSIERPTTRNNRFEAAKFEVPALRWADLGDGNHGFSLINESKYGYDAKGNTLRISLLRSPTWPDPDADRGHHNFSYSLYPHSGDWRQALTVRRGYEFNYKLSAMQVDAHEGTLPATHSFVDIKAANVVLTAMKKTEDGNGLLFRFYEWAGKTGNVTIVVPPGATDATLTDLMERPQGSAIPVTENQVSLPVHPFEIVSVRVNYPNNNAK
ncbi:MAG: glycoside hydrolase family 38 C-terminal domain-containing protein [Terriglobales bacterium]|jgi:alpha-mannosidase